MKYLCRIAGEYFGGCESYALRVAKRAEANGLTVTVVCATEACAETMRQSGCDLRVIKLNSPRIARRFRGGYRLEGAVKLLSYFQYLMSERPDVVHAVLPWHTRGLAWIKACTTLRIPVMITFQLVGSGWPPDRKHIRVRRKAKERGTRPCAVSLENRRLLCDYYGFKMDNVAVINNRFHVGGGPLDCEQRRHLRCELVCLRMRP